jgi:hypothetical protein
MQGLFWSYFKYQSVCVIPFSNHDWKQTTSLYHVIYITACEGICSYLSVFGFATCITSSCTLVAKRVEVVPCYTCYYYYYVKAFVSSSCFFSVFYLLWQQRGVFKRREICSFQRFSPLKRTNGSWNHQHYISTFPSLTTAKKTDFYSGNIRFKPKGLTLFISFKDSLCIVFWNLLMASHDLAVWNWFLAVPPLQNLLMPCIHQDHQCRKKATHTKYNLLV